MSLHLNYRPQALDEFVGNIREVEKLEAVLERKKDRPHTFLFTGPRGCGKTTLARIAAKQVGCHENDILEIDVTTNRGIDSAKELKHSMMFTAMYGDSKAYILDEVHQGTSAYFNALLKPLEEAPGHVYFFLCTTDPQKVLKTVRSRCMEFSVEPLDDKDLLDLLNYVCEEEEVDIDKKHLKNIVKASDCIPREALIMLDSIIDLEEHQLEDAIKSVKTQEKQVIDLCRALVERKSWKIVSGILKALKEDPEKVRWAILGYMNSVLLGGDGSAALIIEEFSEPFYNNGKAGLTKACYLSLE